MNHKRLPRRVRLGLGYVVEVVLAKQSVICDVMDADDEEQFDGAWCPHLGEGMKFAGIIYIDQGCNAAQRRTAFWHELQHALVDIKDFDGENGN